MDLFKLVGTIAVKNAEARKSLNEVSSDGQKTESKLSKAFSVIGRGAAVAGKAIATGLAVGATAMATLTVKALQASGDLEQNMGGAEAVFGELGKTISDMKTPMQVFNSETGKVETQMKSLEEVSKQAYQNMGLSQSDYLATANKMGALFKGAGFETQEALDLSSQAMQRAADVASIMGIDTESAMEAVAGAAKGNFTMMDNLGVAMNDTAIGAYALEKGINKSTSEMSQQEKIGLAMEMFLDKTAYAAGNYAKENETLAGSLGTAKAAFQNFLAGSGDVSSLVSSFSNLANVVVKNLTEIAPRLTQGISDLLQQVVPLIPPLLNQLLPVIVQGAITLVNGLVAALPGVIQAIMASLPTLIDGVLQLITQLATALPQIIQLIVQALPQIIQAIVSALPTLIPALISGLIQCITMIRQSLVQLIMPIIEALPEILISIIQAIVDNLPVVIQGLIQLIMGIVQALPQIIQALVDALPTVISLIIQAVLNLIPEIIVGLIQVVMGIVQALPQILGSLIQAVPAILSGIWDGIKNVFGGLGEWFSNMWNSLGNVPGLSSMKTMIENVWGAIKSHISTVINAIKNVVSTVWNSIKSVVSTVLNSIKNVISTAWDAVKTIISNVMKLISSVLKGDWDGVKSAISNILNAIKSVIKSVWDGIKKTISSVMDGIKSVVSSVWNGIKSVVSSALDNIKSIASSVWNSIKGAISGAVNGIKTTVTTGFNDVKNKVTGAFKDLPTKLKNIGKNLVEGLWKGINNAKDWVLDKIKGFGKGILNGLKSFFGIQSPSRVFRDEIGKQLADGVAVGIDANSENAESAAEKMGKKVLDAAQKRLDGYKAYNEMTLADEMAFWDSVRQQVTEGTDARLQADQKYLEAKKSINEQIGKAEDDLQKKLDEVAQRLDERAQEHLDSFGGLFGKFEADSSISNKSMLEGLKSQINAFEIYDESLEKLHSRMGDSGLFEELKAQGMDAIEEIYILSKVSDAELQEFVRLYEQRNSFAQTIANKEFDFAGETQKAFEEFALACGELGVDVSGSIETMQINASNSFATFTTSIVNGLSSLKDALANFKNNLQLPNLSVQTDLNTDGEPSLNVEWYASAMKAPKLMNEPTIFGYNSATGKYMAGGEAGSEVISGTTTLMNMIQTAVSEQNGKMVAYLHKIVEMLAAYFPQLLEAFDVDLYINGRVLAAELAPDMNDALGIISSRKDRGR